MNHYTTTIHIQCPFQPVWDYYEVELQSGKMVQCEVFEECCDQVRGMTTTQEEAAEFVREFIRLKIPGLIFTVTVMPQLEWQLLQSVSRLISLRLYGILNRHTANNWFYGEQMAMRRKVSAVAKVKKTWRCPKCGHKIETAECYGCLIEEQRKKKGK